MGVFELEPFAAGTRGVAEAVAGLGRVHASSAAATASSRCGSSGLDARSTTSRPAAARRSSSSRAATCPGIDALEDDREMARRPIIAGNWKMHKTHFEAIQTVQKLSYLLDKDDVEQRRGRGLPALHRAARVQTLIESDRLRFRLGAQNFHWEDKGAFTGEVSPPMLASSNVALRDRRATPSGASSSARPTRW